MAKLKIIRLKHYNYKKVMRVRLFVLITVLIILVGFIIFCLLFSQKSPLFGKAEEPNSDIPNLILKENLSLGEKSENEYYLFTRIRIDLDDEERLYVLDEKFRNIRVFDRKGKFVQFIGEKGQGPGEYQYPVTFIQVTSKKELVVYDRGVKKFIFYSLDGKYLKEIRAGRLGIPFNIRIDSKGNFFCFYSWSPPSLELKRFNSDFEVLDTFFSQPVDMSSGYDLKVAQPTLHFALTHDDNIIWGYSDRYELNVHNLAGQLIRKIIWNQKPVKFSKKDRIEYRKRYEALIARGAKLIFPSHFPAFADISVDDKNRIFVMTYKKNKEGKNYFDVFDLEGKHLTRVLLPFSPLIWKNNKVYAVFRDEEGYSIIKRYAVEWK